MHGIVIGVAAAAFCATLLGGWVALRFKDQLHLVLGFSAGAVIGVAFFDLLPEAIDLATPSYPITLVTSIVALAFLMYLFVDRLVVLHAHADEEGHGGDPMRGIIGAGSLSFHSFLDGLGIGFAFQVSPTIGAIVTAAVLTHDFSDGINTINLILKNGGEPQKAFKWLLSDALAPLIGVVTTFFFTVPQEKLGLILATFCGFFLYIGASDLLPESHHRHPTIGTTLMTLAGVGMLYLAVSFASI